MGLRRHSYSALLASCIALLATAAPAAADGSGPCANATAEAGQLSPPVLEASVLCLINQRRSAHGLRAVRPHRVLRRAGIRHSRAMVQQGFFDHTWPSGLTFLTRIKQSGFMRGARDWFVGENLVWGSGSKSTPRALIVAWMGSPPHRRNLLQKRFRRIGVAAVRGTPFDARDRDGITVSTEYGLRIGSSKRRPARRR